MLRWRVPLLLAGLLLLVLVMVIIGDKLRSGKPSVVPMPTANMTEVSADGRVVGYEDDPLVIYCKAGQNKIEVYRVVNGSEQLLYTFDVLTLDEAPHHKASVRLNNGDMLSLSLRDTNHYYLSFRQQGNSGQVGYFSKSFDCA
jgi:hypothetical protein